MFYFILYKDEVIFLLALIIRRMVAELEHHSKMVMKERCQDSHKRVSSSKRAPVIFIQMWLRGCEEGYSSCAERVQGWRILCGSQPLLSVFLSFISLFKRLTKHAVSQVCMAHSSTNPLIKMEGGRERRSSTGGVCIGAARRWDGAGCFFFLVFRFENHPLNV